MPVFPLILLLLAKTNAILVNFNASLTASGKCILTSLMVEAEVKLGS